VKPAVCRFCGASLRHTFADLGMSPISNAFLTSAMVNRMEPFYPLHAYVCQKCFLVQLEEFEPPEHIFTDDYAYFSSYSDSWLEHARRYTESMIARFGLDGGSNVVEIASNDGYLLQYFVKRGIPVLGIEPAANVAKAAAEKGVKTLVRFFGTETASALAAEGRHASLLLGNNVLAHVPDLNDFVAGMKVLLAKGGVITMEFPHLLSLMRECQFDTIYHEHFSYFSFLTVRQVFAAQGLRLFDVERLSTHGGSLRIYGCHADDASKPDLPGVTALLREEEVAGLSSLQTYERFAEQVRETKRALLEFLIKVKRSGKTVAAYGAPAKGNTLLNYCGIRTDFIDYAVDRSPQKQGRFLPGVHIPIYPPERIFETRPDYVLILPWNLKHEIVEQMKAIGDWGGRFVVPIPKVEELV
jgi:SAM-dependent methyltransferase